MPEENKFYFTPKHSAAVLDYVFDWAGLDNNTGLSNWLTSGDTIVSYEVIVPEGLVVDSHTLINTSTAVLFWLSGGVSDTEYEIICEIVTSQGRTVRKAAYLLIL